MISLDTRHFLRKKKFWIALFSVLIIASVISVDLNKAKQEERRQLQSMMIQYKQNIDQNLKRLFHAENTYTQTIRILTDDFETFLNANDFKGINHTLADIYVMEAQRISALYEIRNQDTYLRDYLANKEDVDRLIKERELPIFTLADIRNEFNTTSPSMDETMLYPYYQFQASFYHQMDQMQIERLTFSTVDSGTVILQFMRSMFPILPVIITLLLCYDSLQEDKDSGVIKVLMTQPIERSVYIRRKITFMIKALLCIFFIPLLALSLFYGAQDHFKNMSAPVLANVQGITNMDMMENSLQIMEKENGNLGTIGVTSYFSLPYNSMSPNVEFDFMPMWQFSALCMLMGIMIIAFVVLVHMLTQVVFSNKAVAFIVCLIIFLLGMYVCNANTIDRIYGYLPFTFLNPVQILSGLSTFTYLNGIVVLGMSNVILYIVIQQLYKRKDRIC